MIMSKSKTFKKNGSKAKSNTKHSPRNTIDSYNLYYALERERILKQHRIPPHVKYTYFDERKKYGDLAGVFPPRPSRYESLELSDFWFLKNYQDAIYLKDLSKTIASSWRNCDAEVKGYVKVVAKIIKDHRKEILSSKSPTKSSILPSLSFELKGRSDVAPKFEPAMKDDPKKCDFRLCMNSNTTISVHDVEYAVHNLGMQQNHHQQQQHLANLRDIFQISFQQQMILPYLNAAPHVNVFCNTGVQQNQQQQQMANPEVIGKSLGKSDATKVTQNENTMSYQFVKKHIAERAQHRNDEKFVDFSLEAEVTTQYDDEDEQDDTFESFLEQDPDKCGWLQSAYFKNEKRNPDLFTE